MELRFFDPFAEIRHTRNRLPHWQQPGASYFITFRLADAVPASLRDECAGERNAWLAHHPLPWNAETEREYHRRFSFRIEAWLDAGHGACVLRASECRAVVAETFAHFDGERYFLHAWVVMPNHAHVLVSLHPDASLDREIGAWKSVSSRRINTLLARRGTLWQEDYFDRLVRDEGHFARCVRYIRRNPEKARLRADEYAHYEADWVRGIGEGAPTPRGD